MTFENAPSSIDGATLTSALIRKGTFAGTNGTEGIVGAADLKVTQLGTPGVGVQIAAGVGLVLNGYQTAPSETYVVPNPGVHTIPSGEMPASNPSPKSYIVAVVIGDPDFSQTGHPWMLATDPPAGEELTFQYVRPTLVEVSAGATEIAGANYPYLALARIDIPASTTTIIDSYITDLRSLAQPRSDGDIQVSPSGAWTGLNVYLDDGASYVTWGAGQFAPQVAIPSWAKRAIMVAKVNGARIVDTSVNTAGKLRAKIGSVAGPLTVWDLTTATGGARVSIETAGEFDVSTIAGTTVTLAVEGYQDVPATPATNQRIQLTTGSQQIFDIRFFEE